MSGTNGNGNGNGDWAASFAVFHERHKDKSGKKLKFTSVWNTQLEAWMDDPEVPLEWRCLAFAWRFSQGNSSDYCVDKIGGRRIGQKECAERFAVDKRRVSDAFGYLKGLYYIEPGKGYSISPVDNPAERQSKSPCPSGLSEPPKTEFQAFLDHWRVHAPADSAEFESAYATVKRIKKVRWGLFRKWRTARTATPMPVTTLQPVGQGQSSESPDSSVSLPSGLRDINQDHPAGGRAKNGSPVEREAADPSPARPQEPDLLKTELNQRKLFPDDELLERLRAELAATPIPHFLLVLDQRLKRGQIGTGLLMKQAQKARESCTAEPELKTAKCRTCKVPIPGAAINGECLDCFEARASLQTKGAAS